jgi:hypothetical protein
MTLMSVTEVCWVILLMYTVSAWWIVMCVLR